MADAVFGRDVDLLLVLFAGNGGASGNERVENVGFGRVFWGGLFVSVLGNVSPNCQQ